MNSIIYLSLIGLSYIGGTTVFKFIYWLWKHTVETHIEVIRVDECTCIIRSCKFLGSVVYLKCVIIDGVIVESKNIYNNCIILSRIKLLCFNRDKTAYDAEYYISSDYFKKSS